ncbi:MAG: phosphopantothenoylcysteine decarboxylase [Phycisphaerales bacterium]
MTDTSRAEHILIAAGPTYESIDAVRFLGNRSSGRLGSSLADEAARRGVRTTLLLGPNAVLPAEPDVELVRFESTADLQGALREHLASASILVMAAAVADYRPKEEDTTPGGKRRRVKGGMTLNLEATPDLLAGCSEQSEPDQLLVGFALEPKDELMASALRKLDRKGIDLIVANALETMDSPTINATLIGNKSRGIDFEESTGGTLTKHDFAGWLLDRILPLAQERCSANATGQEQTHGTV